MTDWSFAETLTVGQVAELCGVTERTVCRWTDEGVLATRINPEGRGRVWSGQQVRSLVQARHEVKNRHRLRARCYQAALCRLRDRHEREFAALLRALMDEEHKKVASPADSGDAGVIDPQREE